MAAAAPLSAVTAAAASVPPPVAAAEGQLELELELVLEWRQDRRRLRTSRHEPCQPDLELERWPV